MSAEAEGGAAPMEEEQVPLPLPNNADSPSADSANSMDWVKVDESTRGDETKRAESPEPTGTTQHAITQSVNPEMPSNPPNFDEYSFGSSDGDDDDEEEVDGLGKFANVSLDTAFDMSILQGSIEKSADALDLVVGKDVVMVVGKTG